MGEEGTGSGRASASVIDKVVAHGRAVRPDDAERIEAFLRAYFAHVGADDLLGSSLEDLFGLAMEHARLGDEWESGSISVAVLNPRVDVDGWDSQHTVVMTVTDDLPFLVDSVTMEMSRLGLGIHLVVHPILVDRRHDGMDFANPRDHEDGQPGLCSFIAIEVDRQTDPAQLDGIRENVLRVLGDVRAACEDWPGMRQRMRDIAAGLTDAALPLDHEEVTEGRELLEWLAENHFIFLGYREYRLDGDDLTADAGSGLGILRFGGGPPPKARKLTDLAPQVAARADEPRLLNLTKAGSKSTVHRASYLDYVGVKTFDETGRVNGEQRFLGLYTSEVYTRSVTRVPRVQRLVAEVLERAAYPPGGHDAKRLLNILEDYPRDELLQIDADELFETAMAIAGLQERRRARLFARPELFERFVTCMVYLPRDRYNTATRSGIQELLLRSYGGSTAEWSTRISESVLARILFQLRIESGHANRVDVADLERQIEDIIRDWDEEFAEEAVAEFGEEAGVALARRYAAAFPLGYRDGFTSRNAVSDLRQLEQIGDNGELRLAVYRVPGQPNTAFKLKLYRSGERVSLTSVMPTLTNLGLTVVDERTFEVRPSDGDACWIYDFSLEHPDQRLEFAEVAALLEQTFGAVWRGERVDDGFNRLVLRAGMAPHEVGILRAYARYLQQTGVSYSPQFIEQTLTHHWSAARLLVDLFAARFDPDRSADVRADEAASLSAAFFEVVDEIKSLDQDRVLRRFHDLIENTLRTNAFQVAEGGSPPPYLVFKLDPSSIRDLPEPRPQYELFVYSPRFEGVHLRGGAVARGGLRWSDRTEDYRTEVLGLLKAQMVKNAVIVPAGAKGGFILKRAPGDAAELRGEVIACYELFVSALLDVTDNLVDGEVVAPARTVRHDGDDTYLVVAADKGTATFSDNANRLALERGFWLGDAFASGGSQGYDHKGMAITARGAWESVKRHFRELGHDIQSEPFTAVGVGDMSGDVFGNGMLLSPHTKLIAAFDHRHVFVDPDPDPAASHAERARLFALARSSWADYDTALLSQGGGVYQRSAKSLELSTEAQHALGVDRTTLTPDELISAVLRAPVDLLWNGGIGTYVKASDETHADVGDKGNDTIRVDAAELRVKVIGEGGNLGVTQRGRIEFASRTGRIYTDAIDNVGGVDCSDHEVNIKILLDEVVRNGDLTAKQRNELLADMTDDVAELVLTNNRRQTAALSSERIESTSLVDVHARYLSHLEAHGLLDRELEGLPDADTMAERRLAEAGLTTPEVAVLLAYTKNGLNRDLLDSDVPDDATFEPLVVDYFPAALQERFGDRIRSHRLRRQIIANRISNLVVDRGGVTMVYRLAQETSAPSHEVAAAHMAAWEIFELDELNTSVDDLGATLPAQRQLQIQLAGRQLAERATRLLMRNRPHPFSAANAIADLADAVHETLHRTPQYLVGADLAAFESEVAHLCQDGVPERLARHVASLLPSLAALDIVEAAAGSGVPVTTVAAVHFAIADLLELNWLRDRILALPRDSQWASLARLTLRGDLYTDHRALTERVSGRSIDADADDLVTRWMDDHEGAVANYRRTIAEIRSAGPTDLTTLLVAAREVRNLIARTASLPLT